LGEAILGSSQPLSLAQISSLKAWWLGMVVNVPKSPTWGILLLRSGFFQPTILYKPTFYAGHSDIVGYGNTMIGFLQNWRLGHPWTHKVAPMLSRNPSNFGAEWAIQPQPHFPEIQPGKTFIYIIYQIKPLKYIYIYVYIFIFL